MPQLAHANVRLVEAIIAAAPDAASGKALKQVNYAAATQGVPLLKILTAFAKVVVAGFSLESIAAAIKEIFGTAIPKELTHLISAAPEPPKKALRKPALVTPEPPKEGHERPMHQYHPGDDLP